jgi:tyrosine-protein phosphatase SIW14
MKKNLIIIIVALLLLILSDAFSRTRVRPDKWASKVIESSLKNWYKLDNHIYRSEQPDEKEFKIIKELGIGTILNLRERHTDNKETKNINLKLYHYKLSTRKINYNDLVKILKIIKKEKSPILIHCWHGSDRTGAVAAVYRIIFQNWSKKDALDELINGGYGYHSIFTNIPELIKNLNIKKLKKDVLK